jgi:hypothetical protein
MNSVNGGDGSQTNHLDGPRRVISGVHEQTYEEYDRTRKRSFQPHFETLFMQPSWKKGGLDSLTTTSGSPVVVRRANTDSSLTQLGDALKGDAPDDLILSPTTPPHIFRRALHKISNFLLNDSDDNIEPPLTALLAGPEPDEDTKHKVAITSGSAAPGLAQAGSALASSIGGGIGSEILVELERSDKMDNPVLLPTASQDTVATGVDR